ncbi:MAG: hypothetical protein JWP74_1849 [Marmoricola sp.]|nr:hypothetical protein [Marmoricola sp.]
MDTENERFGSAPPEEIQRFETPAWLVPQQRDRRVPRPTSVPSARIPQQADPVHESVPQLSEATVSAPVPAAAPIPEPTRTPGDPRGVRSTQRVATLAFALAVLGVAVGLVQTLQARTPGSAALLLGSAIIAVVARSVLVTAASELVRQRRAAAARERRAQRARPSF